ncbi:hypothetical protein [Stappia sp.]|uniref:hypothetical protein n=1 Tax=Stappia sp. TaxID=1870903 RepID=UPI0032D8DA33
MKHSPHRPAVILALAGPLLLPLPAAAFDATGNAIADRFLETVDAGNASVTGYDAVSESDGVVIITGLTATIQDDDDTSRLSVATTEIENGALATDGGLTAAFLEMRTVVIEAADGDDDVRVTVEAIAISDPVLPAPDTVRTSPDGDGLAPSYSRAELTGLVIETEDEGTIPIARAVAMIDRMDGDLPTAGSILVEGIQIEADALDEDEREALAELGYDSLTLTLEARADWEPDTGALVVDTLTISGENAGTLTASLRLAGLTREVVEQLDAAQDNPEQAMGLMQGLLLEEITLRIDNASLIERVLDRQAEEAGTTREAFVEQLAGALPMMLSILDNAEFQTRVADAAGTFLRDPQSLSATAKPAAPVAFAQILGTAMMAPQALPDILGVTILANEN